MFRVENSKNLPTNGTSFKMAIGGYGDFPNHIKTDLQFFPSSKKGKFGVTINRIASYEMHDYGDLMYNKMVIYGTCESSLAESMLQEKANMNLLKMSKDYDCTIEIFGIRPNQNACEYYVVHNGQYVLNEARESRSYLLKDYGMNYDRFISEVGLIPLISREEFQTAIETCQDRVCYSNCKFLDLIPNDRPFVLPKDK